MPPTKPSPPRVRRRQSTLTDVVILPSVYGRYPIDERWFIELPCVFSRRIQRGALVLSRPGIVLSIETYLRRPHLLGESVNLALADVPERIRDFKSEFRNGLWLLTYRALFDDCVGSCLTSIAISKQAHLTMLARCSTLSCEALAEAVWNSLRQTS